jgi:hypothetical protein
MDYVKRELSRGIGDWEQRLGTALVKSSPTDLVRTVPQTKSQDAGVHVEGADELEEPRRKA